MRGQIQRERAVNEYTQAQGTRDSTLGAQDELAKYLRQAYKRETKVPNDQVRTYPRSDATKVIDVGQTKDQVTAILGKPVSIRSSENRRSFSIWAPGGFMFIRSPRLR
jgi:hypothetical protein